MYYLLLSSVLNLFLNKLFWKAIYLSVCSKHKSGSSLPEFLGLISIYRGDIFQSVLTNIRILIVFTTNISQKRLLQKLLQHEHGPHTGLHQLSLWGLGLGTGGAPVQVHHGPLLKVPLSKALNPEFSPGAAWWEPTASTQNGLNAEDKFHAHFTVHICMQVFNRYTHLCNTKGQQGNDVFSLKIQTLEGAELQRSSV